MVTPSATCQANFESGVAIILRLWDDLTFAVENNLGGGDSADKRDWLGGAVVELFPAITSVDDDDDEGDAGDAATGGDLVADVEARLLQVLDDEFDTIVDDGSAYDVATQVAGLYLECRRGVFRELEDLRRRWDVRKDKKVSAAFREGEAQDQETDWESGDEDDEDDEDDSGSGGEGDVEMQDAPPRQKNPPPPPEVDEDGFTKVTRKRK